MVFLKAFFDTTFLKSHSQIDEIIVALNHELHGSRTPDSTKAIDDIIIDFQLKHDDVFDNNASLKTSKNGNLADGWLIIMERYLPSVTGFI